MGLMFIVYDQTNNDNNAAKFEKHIILFSI